MSNREDAEFCSVCFIAQRYPVLSKEGFSVESVLGEFATKSEQMPQTEVGQIPPARLRVLPTQETKSSIVKILPFCFLRGLCRNSADAKIPSLERVCIVKLGLVTLAPDPSCLWMTAEEVS